MSGTSRIEGRGIPRAIPNSDTRMISCSRNHNFNFTHILENSLDFFHFSQFTFLQLGCSQFGFSVFSAIVALFFGPTGPFLWPPASHPRFPETMLVAACKLQMGALRDVGL